MFSPMRRRGFTLIELMMVVGIMSVLAALAIPNLQRFQRRAKSAEALTNLNGIHKAEVAYFTEAATYVQTGGPTPTAVPGTARAAWPPGSPFDQIGWQPEGSVYFQYAVTADNNGSGLALVRYTSEAASDIDGDGSVAFFGMVKPVAGAAAGIAGSLPGSTCAATGVYNPSTGLPDLLDTPGACDAISGRSIF